MLNKLLILLFMMSLISFQSNAQYTMPIETSEHEGTWVQWPHNYLYPPYYRSDLEETFIEMTRELVKGENLHIIAYDGTEQDYIEQTLTNAGVSLEKVDFYIHPTDDCWVRDNGTIFVYDDNNNLAILDWGFNGWGNDTPYDLCNAIPQAVSSDIGIPNVDLNNMILEGGAFEIDGNGTFLATKSSILGNDRNPNLTQAEVENYLSIHLGVSNFIWLEGIAGLEITDMHIDGFAKFHDSNAIVCMDSLDLLYWEVPPSDISILMNAQNIDGNSYDYIFLPLTQNNVVTTWGQNLGYKGSYVNYYVGNAVVLVPVYNDPNDDVAISILQNLYTDREVVGIDVRNLYSNGGMVHCITQQQPKNINAVNTFTPKKIRAKLFQNNPNPFQEKTTIEFSLNEAAKVELIIFNIKGEKIKTLVNASLSKGQHSYIFENENLANGVYSYSLVLDGKIVKSKKMTLQK